MNWLILTILAILSRAVYGLSTKVLSNKVKASPVVQTTTTTIFAGIISLAISPFIGGVSMSGVTSAWLQIAILLACFSLANILYYVGIKTLDSSTTQVAFSSILIWGTLFSVLFLNSKFSMQQMLGVIILLIAILLTQYSQRQLKINKGIIYIAMAAALFAVFQVVSAQLSKTIGVGAYLLIAYFGSTLLFVFAFFPKFRKEIPPLVKNYSTTLKPMLFASSTGMLYFVFSFFAYKVAPDSGVVVLLLTSQVIVAVILSIIFLKEKGQIKQKIIAGVLAVIAGILIKG